METVKNPEDIFKIRYNDPNTELLIEKYFGNFLALLSCEQEANKDEIILIIFFILKVLNNIS